MAEYLFLPYLAHGHVNPMLAVAAEIVRRGERVRVVASEEFAGHVTAAGAQVLDVPGHDVRVPARRGAFRPGERIGLLTGRWVAWAGAIGTVRQYLATHRPAVVLADVRLPWAAPVVRGAGVPLVSLCTTYTGALRGCGPVLINAPSELQPAMRRPHRARLVAPLVRPDEPETVLAPLRDWLDRGPTLLVAPGTVFAREHTFFRRVAEEFAGSRWQVLMATGPTPVHELGPLPPNVLARRWLPQRGLLRHATVLLGHGGMNSVQEALLAGVPMMLNPRSREQARTVRRLAELGLAVPADGAFRLRAEQVAADDRMHTACLAMRDRLLAAPGVALAADVLTGIGATGGVDQARHVAVKQIWSRQRR